MLLPLLINIAVIVISLSPASAVALPTPPTGTTRRWIYPCHGGEAIPLPSTTITTSTTTTSGFYSTSALNTLSGLSPTTSGSSLDVEQLADSFHAISTKATRLKRHVRELKDLYVCMPSLHLHNLC